MYKILANTEIIGKRVIYLPSCHSTNTESAKLLDEKKIKHGDIVITDHQVDGKGQGVNTWDSDPGKNLTFSIVLFPSQLKAVDQFYLTIGITLGIIEFLSYYGLNAWIKWPNDILVNHHKIAGILITNSIRGSYITDSIIGIGLNINQEHFKVKATSLKLNTGKSYTLSDTFNKLIMCLDKFLDFNLNREMLKDHYHKNLYGVNMQKDFWNHLTNTYFRGVIKGTDQRGKLIIESEGKQFLFNNKEIAFIF